MGLEHVVAEDAANVSTIVARSGGFEQGQRAPVDLDDADEARTFADAIGIRLQVASQILDAAPAQCLEMGPDAAEILQPERDRGEIEHLRVIVAPGADGRNSKVQTCPYGTHSALGIGDRQAGGSGRSFPEEYRIILRCDNACVSLTRTRSVARQPGRRRFSADRHLRFPSMPRLRSGCTVAASTRKAEDAP